MAGFEVITEALGLIYRDHLADPVANHQGVNIATKVADNVLPLALAVAGGAGG